MSLLAPPGAAAQDTTGVGAIAGVVRSGASQPVSGARVCALDTPACVITDGEGRFRIPDVRPGSYRLEILPPEGLPITSEPVEVRAGLEGSVDVQLPDTGALAQTVTVTAPAFAPPAEVRNSAFLVAPRSVLKSAGALQDVSRYVQSLPGVVIGTNDFRNDIIVRGGSPLENLFVVDNVEIPNINTFANFASAGGTVSIVDAELLKDVTFLTGGFPAPYTNRTSSVLQITQREGSRERVAGTATLGFAGAGAVLEGPLAGGKGSWVASARRSFLDVVTDDIGIGGVPVLYTVNAKAVYDLSPRDRVWAVSITGVDRIRLGLTDSSDLDEDLANFYIRYDGWRSASGFNWQHLFGARAVGLLGVTHSEARLGQQVKDLVRDGVPPVTADPGALIEAGPIVYREDSREGESTVKYDLTLTTRVSESVRVGGSVKVFGIDYAVESPFGNDTPYSPVPGLDPFVLRTRFTSAQTGAYVQATRRLASRVSLTLGGRFDHYAFLDRVRLSPRAGLKVDLAPALSWNSSAGSYYQQPAFLFAAAYPENRALAPWRADHYVTGLAWTPRADTRITIEGYSKAYSDYPVASELPSVSLANIGDTFDVREILFRLVSRGRGRAQGVELFAERRAGRLRGQASLAMSRTRHAGLDGVFRPGSFDYPLVLNVVGSYRAGSRWELSTRASFLSGRPYTPFDEDASAAQRRGVYDLARVNAVRAPDYVRIDLRVDRTFTVGDRPLNLFVGVQNLANRRNVGSYRWNGRLNAAQPDEQQGLFPILGLDWRF